MVGIKELLIQDYFPMISEAMLASDEERYFVWWLVDLYKAGYVKNVLFEPTSFKLSDGIDRQYEKVTVMKTKTKRETFTETVMKPSVYTPDFVIMWTEKAVGIFVDSLYVEGKRLMKGQSPLINIGVQRGLDYMDYVEIKPDFDHKNMTRLARTNIKWTWHNHNVFVNLVKVPSLFKKTFTPERYIYNNKNGKRRDIKFKVRGVAEYINSLSA